MAEVIRYSDEHKMAWSDYVEKSSHSTVAHLIGWKDVIQGTLFHNPTYLMAVEGSKVRGILPLFLIRTWWRSRYYISVPWIDYGGVCADGPDIEQLLISEARRLSDREKVEFMELRSIRACDSNLAERSDKVTFLLELDRDSEKLWKNFNFKLRNKIRKSIKAELTTEFGGEELLPSFYDVFSRNMRDLGTPVWGFNFFESILRRLPDHAEIVVVRKDSRVIAGGLVLSFKDRLYVPSSSAYREAFRYGPNYALFWAVARKGCEQGYRYLDFGRSSWDSSTFIFKKQWVSTPTQLVWQYYLRKSEKPPAINPTNPKYRLFIGLWKRLPIPVANYLGPKVIRNFP